MTERIHLRPDTEVIFDLGVNLMGKSPEEFWKIPEENLKDMFQQLHGLCERLNYHSPAIIALMVDSEISIRSLVLFTHIVTWICCKQHYDEMIDIDSFMSQN